MVKLSWCSLPFKEHRRKTVLLIIFLIVVGVGLYFSFGLYWLIFAYILLVGSIFSYFLPAYYSMDEAGITIKGIIAEHKKSWAQFKSYYPDKNGVLLSPFLKPTRLENFRGIYIRFCNNREEVISFISAHITTPNEVM